MPDIAGDSTTTATISFGGTVTGSLETGGDQDWFRVSLTAGQQISITVSGSGTNALEDPFVYLRNASGLELASDDDSGSGRNSELVFTVQTTGTYYIDVGAWTPDPGSVPDGYTGTGTYQVSVGTYVAPVLSVWSNDQVARQLTHDFWGGSSHRFNVGDGDTLTVNLTGLTSDGRYLARSALELWSDVIGVRFTEVTTGGAIVFDDNEEGAHADAVYSGGITSTANVNVGIQWINDYGSGLSSYSFQTYVHEIGHALGLGHAGDYNGEADYSVDAMYLNDGWPTSVMSYFSQTESTHFANLSYSNNYALTPMVADIVAMASLYGLSSSTRLGNTTYGFNSNANRSVFDATQNGAQTDPFAYTIIDSGGVDTLDYSGYSANQVINLNAEAFSNVGGDNGNVAIARGTVIENAIGGAGNDTLIGNAANNLLDGGGGRNVISYQRATAGVVVNASVTTAQNTVGAGVDTLRSFAEITGSRYDDTLTGRSTGVTLEGGHGNDRLIAVSAADSLYGGDGDDTLVLTASPGYYNGGSGSDTADFSQARAGVQASAGTSASVETIVGSNFADVLRGFPGPQGNEGLFVLIGGGGDDELHAPFGFGRLEGGSGNDTYFVGGSTTEVVENAGAGVDEVQTEYSYTLGANVENLTLLFGAAVNGVGNSLANQITGGSGANRLYGLAGEDRLHGNAGNDRLDGGTGIDRMYGGAGDDIYFADSGDGVYELAGEGIDLVYASAVHTLRANVENLTLIGTSGLTGKGNDSANILTGNAAGNRLYGVSGDDRLYGLAGNDRLDGGLGADRIYGGKGNDIYVVDNVGDIAIEYAGEGTDVVYASITYVLRPDLERLYLTGTANIIGKGNDLGNILLGNGGSNRLYGLDGDDRAYGGAGNDLLDGGNGNDRLDGDAGNDKIYGGADADVLIGDGGADWLQGGAGRDRMYGGTGEDRFAFDNLDFGGTSTSTADQIHDFGDAEGDRIHLSLVDANSLVSGDQAFAWIGTSAFSGAAGELRTLQSGGNTYVQGDINGDGTADFLIRLDGLHTLGTDDFIF